jgi:glycosyltransferase involved in cell wall biosynthesis
MNLLFVDASRRGWGTEQHFAELARGCREAGHRVVAVVRAGSDVARLLSEAGVETRAIHCRGGADPRMLLHVQRAMMRIDADWIVTHRSKLYWSMLVLAKLNGVRLAAFRHLAYIRPWHTRVLFPRLVDRFFVVSDFALEALALAGAPRRFLRRLYNPIDLGRFHPCAEQRRRTRAALQLPHDALLVGFVGRHEEGKGVRALRSAIALAMAADPRVHALWLGAGPQWEETAQALAAEVHSGRHRLIDWSSSPERYYAALDCLVAPSVIPETFGRVVAEAQACGVPVIASTIGGLCEAFGPGLSGHALTTLKATDIAAAILDLLGDRDRRQNLATEGRRYVERFETSLIVAAFIAELSSP